MSFRPNFELDNLEIVGRPSQLRRHPLHQRQPVAHLPDLLAGPPAGARQGPGAGDHVGLDDKEVQPAGAGAPGAAGAHPAGAAPLRARTRRTTPSSGSSAACRTPGAGAAAAGGLPPRRDAAGAAGGRPAGALHDLSLYARGHRRHLDRAGSRPSAASGCATSRSPSSSRRRWWTSTAGATAGCRCSRRRSSPSAPGPYRWSRRRST